MKQFKYGFYGEDDAHKIFLHNYLKHFDNDAIVFVRDDYFCGKFRANSKKQVDTKFAYVAREGLVNYQHDVFFVGRDIDSHQDAQFRLRHHHFAKEGIGNLLLMLPVQCVEHWLWLLKYRRGIQHRPKTYRSTHTQIRKRNWKCTARKARQTKCQIQSLKH